MVAGQAISNSGRGPIPDVTVDGFSGSMSSAEFHRLALRAVAEANISCQDLQVPGNGDCGLLWSLAPLSTRPSRSLLTLQLVQNGATLRQTSIQLPQAGTAPRSVFIGDAVRLIRRLAGPDAQDAQTTH